MSDIDESFCKLDYVFTYYSTWTSLQAFCLLFRNSWFKEQFLLVRTISILICRSDKWRIHFLVKLHGEPCLTVCLNKIKVLIGKHFFCYFKENLGTNLTHFSISAQCGLLCRIQPFVLLCKSGDWFQYGMQRLAEMC